MTSEPTPSASIQLPSCVCGESDFTTRLLIHATVYLSLREQSMDVLDADDAQYSTMEIECLHCRETSARPSTTASAARLEEARGAFRALLTGSHETVHLEQARSW